MKYVSSMLTLLLLAANLSAQLMSSHATTSAAPNAGATVAPARIADKPVARVNGVALTDRDLVRMEYAIFPYARQHGGLPKSMEPQIRQGAMEMIIFEELAYQEAIRRHMTVPPADVTRGMQAFKSRFPSQQEYAKYLQAECKGSPEVLRQRIRRSMLIDKLLKLEVEQKSAVTVAEAKAFYVANPQRFEVPENFSIQSISVLAPENATAAQLADVKQRAQEAYTQAKATKNYEQFGLLAEKISEDDFRVNMGDHKHATKEKLPQQVLQLLATMKPGDVSPLVQLGDSYTIFRLNQHHAAGKISFADTKSKLIENLRKDKYNKLRADLGERLRRGAKVEVL